MKYTPKYQFSNFTYWSSTIILGLIIGSSLHFVQAWTAPTEAPPDGNVTAPLTTGPATQAKTGKIQTASTIPSDAGATLVTKDYVDAAAGQHVRGGHYGGCWVQYDESFRLTYISTRHWPMLNCGWLGQVKASDSMTCAPGFSAHTETVVQMNTCPGASGCTFQKFLESDAYWAFVSCIKS